MADTFKSSREFAEIIAKETADSRAAGHRVLAYNPGDMPRDLGNLPIHYAFYTNGIYTVETTEQADLGRHLDRDDRVFALVNIKRMNQLPVDMLDRMEIVATTHASRRDVALISNRPPAAGEE